MTTPIVKALRERLGLSQEQLSDALGLGGKNVVSRWEIGERLPSEPLIRLFKYLLGLPRAEANQVLHRFKGYGSSKGGGK